MSAACHVPSQIMSSEGGGSEWTVDTSRAAMNARIDALAASLRERMEAQQRAVDAAYAAHEKTVERAEKSVLQALAASDVRIEDLRTEFHEHLGQVAMEAGAALAASNAQNKIALEASRTAIDKAEAAVDKRLGALNELREVVAQTQRQNIQRTEVEAITQRIDDRIKELTDKLNGTLPRQEGEALVARNTERINDITSRFEQQGGVALGASNQKQESRLDMGQLISILVALVLVISVAATIIIATR